MLSVVLLDMDGYDRNFADRPEDARRRINRDHPDAFELDLLAHDIGELARGRRIEKPVYDFVRRVRTRDTVAVDPARVTIVDAFCC
ncbi:MAG TPA: hypothetical protein VJO52_02270 [Gemmatimonadaceae bacterium]|nr:hypothetical protein [Gemmatimonadaceae bacterium]